MSPARKIAWRYFRGKKSAQAINIISWISIAAIAVSSAAMVVLFSVFNGLEGTVKDLYSAFYPEIKVTPAQGKFFTLTAAQQQQLKALKGVRDASFSIEDMVLLAGNREQKVGTLKGIDDAWFAVCGLDSFMSEGKAGWEQAYNYTPAIVGQGIALSLGVDINNDFSGLKAFYPRLGNHISENPEEALNHIIVKPKGVFKIQVEFDENYVLAPLQAVQYLFHQEGKVSSVEIRLQSPADEARVKSGVEKILGGGFHVENRYEQNKTFFMIMHGEKWAVYAILLMVLVIASFNMIGSLSMVVLEKKKDIAILGSLGAYKGMVRNIFLAEGMLLAGMGGAIGVLFGVLLCLGQMYFGWISLPEGFIITAYPVSIQATDILLVMATAVVVGLLAAWYPAMKAARQPVVLREE